MTPGGLAALALCVGGAVAASQPADMHRGASGTWRRLLALRTTASVLQIAAHPDEETGAVMARLSWDDGVRVDALTLTRGEAGDNAIGAEAFDALGLLRTEELRISNGYYGVDEQYFTTFADLGFSKRSDEALERWGHRNLLAEVVAVIRRSRPLVLLSRFRGTAQDGHGATAASVLVMHEAFSAAADPTMFPEQIRGGLRPWQARKVYIGASEQEPWTVSVDTGVYNPLLGQSPSAMARRGLAFQRSSVSPVNERRHYVATGPDRRYFTRTMPAVLSNAKEHGFFDGIDTSIAGVFTMLGRAEPPTARAHLTAIASAVEAAVRTFSAREPWVVVPALAEGLAATRVALAAIGAVDPDVRFVLQTKERQFQEAITTALALDVTALAEPARESSPVVPSTGLVPPPPMAAPVPGQTFAIVTRVTNPSPVAILPTAVELAADRGWAVSADAAQLRPLVDNDAFARRFAVTLAADVRLSSRPYFSRASFQDPRYAVTVTSETGRPAATAAALAIVRYTVAGVAVATTQTVRRRESKRPSGDALRELGVVPALSVRMSPEHVVVPLRPAGAQVALTVDLLNDRDGAIAGDLTLTVPPGWTAQPARRRFAFAHAGERQAYAFVVTTRGLQGSDGIVTATATANGVRYAEGYDLIDHRDLELRYQYRPATAQVRGVDLATVPGLRVGYVMGVGDQVPAAIRQLGVDVTLLESPDLATGRLARFDTIVIGTRAYAVRDDLWTYNGRLLDYVREGGTLVVLYNTQEFDPGQFAPFPGTLPANAEEVTEEDAPVDIVSPGHRALMWPNRIGPEDFAGWVEQRGSKFWASWDGAYTPLLASNDTGQARQLGGWLTTRYGRGTWTYCAYALHRQLAQGVPGAFRIVANLLALGKTLPQH